MANVEIEICDLRLVLNRILDHIEYDQGITKVSLMQDDYWEVAHHERYDFSKTPQEFEHGQLSDDWGFLSAILKDKNQAVSLMLVHAAPLLRIIGEEVS